MCIYLFSLSLFILFDLYWCDRHQNVVLYCVEFSSHVVTIVALMFVFRTVHVDVLMLESTNRL